MRPIKLFSAVLCLCAWSWTALSQQNTNLYQFKFRGLCYQTNRTGKLVRTPATEQTLLREEATRLGFKNYRALALIYHAGGNERGDTVELAYATNGAAISTLFGFYFGEDQSLLRTAMTNSAGTEVRRIDYLYTRQNSHSMGAAFVTKKYTQSPKKGYGNMNAQGQMHYIFNPDPTTVQKICSGTFTASRLFVPRRK